MMRTRATAWWVSALVLAAHAVLAGRCPGQLRFEKEAVSVPANGSDLLVAEFPFVVGPTDPVVIGEIKPDCSCTTAALDKQIYAVGEKGRIKLEFRVGELAGPQEKRLLVSASDQAEPHVLTLLTDLPRTFNITPRTVYWDHDAALQAKVIHFEVGAGQPAVTSLRVVSDHPLVAVVVREVVAGRKFELHLTPGATTQVLVAKVDLRATYENKAERAFTCFAMVKPVPE